MSDLAQGVLARLAQNMRDWAQSAHENGDDYDEGGKPELAARHWGIAEGYRQAAEMLEREAARL